MLKRDRQSHTVTRTHLIHTRTHDDDNELQTQHRLISKALWENHGKAKKRRISQMARTSHVSVLRSFKAVHRAQGTPPWVERSGTNDAQTSPFSPWMPLEAHF